MISVGRVTLWAVFAVGAATLLAVALLRGGHADLRWAIVLVALGLALVARYEGVAIWFDVLVLTLILGTIVVAHRATTKPPANPHGKKQKAAVAPIKFVLPPGETVAAQGIDRGAGIVILLDSRDGKGSRGYDAHRYEVMFTTAVKPQTESPIAITIKRGPNDSNASKFAAELFGAAEIVVLPPR